MSLWQLVMRSLLPISHDAHPPPTLVEAICSHLDSPSQGLARKACHLESSVELYARQSTSGTVFMGSLAHVRHVRK